MSLGQGHRVVIQCISPDLYILCSKYVRFGRNFFFTWEQRFLRWRRHVHKQCQCIYSWRDLKSRVIHKITFLYQHTSRPIIALETILPPTRLFLSSDIGTEIREILMRRIYKATIILAGEAPIADLIELIPWRHAILSLVTQENTSEI